MAEMFSGIAAVYGELHSLRKQFLFEALPYPYREALKLVPTNLMGSLLFRQDDNELSKELMENNKKRKENLDMIKGPNRGNRGGKGGGNRFQPYSKGNGNNRQNNNRQQYRSNGNRQNNNNQEQDFQRDQYQSRPPQKFNNNNNKKGGYGRK
jgi:hypothetical protein